METLETYEDIKVWKDAHIIHSLTDTTTLNAFHDKIMKKVFQLAINQPSIGNPPCAFSWFITGSGGRLEQGLISDQDHGMIYDIASEENKDYFLQLGKEVSDGLNRVGYPYCNGNIMSSNPLWCHSVDEWNSQLFNWMEEASWTSIRYVQIFFDCRLLIGENDYIKRLKRMIFLYQQHHPTLLRRLTDNIMHVKKGLSPLGQILASNINGHRNAIDLKYAAFLPYVNAVRILAIKEGLLETSTEDRLKKLLLCNHYPAEMEKDLQLFRVLLKYRLELSKVSTYDDTHFLEIGTLDREQKKEIKRILKEGQKLHDYVMNLVQKDVGYGI